LHKKQKSHSRRGKGEGEKWRRGEVEKGRVEKGRRGERETRRKGDA
jgi:hypothetical protein